MQMTADSAISSCSGERKTGEPEKLVASEVDIRALIELDRDDVSPFRNISNRPRYAACQFVFRERLYRITQPRMEGDSLLSGSEPRRMTGGWQCQAYVSIPARLRLSR